MSEIKCNIGHYLNKLGLSQRDLANGIGTSEVSISRYVNGERLPNAVTCIAIARFLGCKVEDLYDLEPTENLSRVDFKNELTVFNKCLEIMEEFDTWDIMKIISFLSQNLSDYRDSFPIEVERSTK